MSERILSRLPEFHPRCGGQIVELWTRTTGRPDYTVQRGCQSVLHQPRGGSRGPTAGAGAWAGTGRGAVFIRRTPAVIRHQRAIFGGTFAIIAAVGWFSAYEMRDFSVAAVWAGLASAYATAISAWFVTGRLP